jgi:hypothetical protein
MLTKKVLRPKKDHPKVVFREMNAEVYLAPGTLPSTPLT